MTVVPHVIGEDLGLANDKVYPDQLPAGLNEIGSIRAKRGQYRHAQHPNSD
jgi:hypothetical protein